MWIKRQDYEIMCNDSEFWRRKYNEACDDAVGKMALIGEKDDEIEKLNQRVKELEEIEDFLSNEVKSLREQLLDAKKKALAYQIYEEKRKAAGQKKSNEERVMMLEAMEEAREKLDIM